ncbi:MAG: archaeosortase/exosortase family protein [Candidatus Hodarchaeota archaeon]
MRIDTNKQISLLLANHAPWIIRGLKTFLSIILIGITGLNYILFADTRDPIYAVIGVSLLGVGLWILLQEYESLRQYEAIILPFISGLFIFLLFMEQGLDEIVLKSEIAYIQIRTSVIISTNVLVYLYILTFILGILLLIPFGLTVLKNKSPNNNTPMLLVPVGILFILISSWNIIQGVLGMPYRFEVREYQGTETLLRPPLELMFSNFYILFLEVGLILIVITVHFLRIQKIDQNNAVTPLVIGSTLILISFWHLIQGISGLGSHLLDSNYGYVSFPAGGHVTTPRTVTIDARCSGIHSFTIFITCFYLTFLYIGRHVEKKRLAIALTIGTFGTLSCNWLRLIFIYLVGYYYGSEPMYEAHDYAGLVIFLIWMVIFWIYALDYLKIRQNVEEGETVEMLSESQVN